MSQMTPERVLAALAKDPKLLYDLIWQIKVLGAWVRVTRKASALARKKGSNDRTTAWTREMHPRLAGETPVLILQAGEVYEGTVEYVVRIDTNGDGDKDHVRSFDNLPEAQAHADQVLQSYGWVLVSEEYEGSEDEHPFDRRAKLEQVRRLLKEGHKSFIGWQADVRVIETQAAANSHHMTPDQIKGKKVASWRNYIRTNAMPRNHIIRDLLQELFPQTPPDPVAEFFLYCEEYDKLFAAWDKGQRRSLASGRNFPADLDGYIGGLIDGMD